MESDTHHKNWDQWIKHNYLLLLLLMLFSCLCFCCYDGDCLTKNSTPKFLTYNKNKNINEVCAKFYGNVKHQFMDLKRVAKLNEYHSPEVGRKYKSKYWIESRHWDLSNHAINFSYWHMKGYFLKAAFYQKIDSFSSHHFMAHYKSPCLGLKSRF